MNDYSTPPQDNLSDELKRLGENINQFAKTAWESPERQKIQQELEMTFDTLGNSLNQAVEQLSQSPTGQQIKNELDDFGQHIAAGEVENQVKKEVSSILAMINDHLEKTTNQWKTPPSANS
jgi:hypothetical protein